MNENSVGCGTTSSGSSAGGISSGYAPNNSGQTYTQSPLTTRGYNSTVSIPSFDGPEIYRGFNGLSPANPLPEVKLRDGEVFIAPMNQGYLLVVGNTNIFSGYEYFAYTKYSEVLKHLRDNKLLTKDDAKVVENI